MNTKTVVVGISGGVDSSVAAKLLKEQGYNVIGVFMKNWEEAGDNNQCTAAKDSLDAQSVCEKIGIPFYEVNFAKEYKDKVFSEFIKDIEMGLTPNPDVLCNREIKFKPFLDYALKLGADYIATGHYADIVKKDDIFQLSRSVDENKDQTYFLNQLNQFELGKTLFPLANLTKPEIRKIAHDCDFITAAKKDSTGICFIGERNFKNFLKNYVHAKKGDIVLENGQKVGEHDGLCFYTLGQSKGLNLGGIKGEESAKRCIVEKNIEKNQLVVGTEASAKLWSRGLVTSDFNFTGEIFKNQTIECLARFRHRQQLQKVTAIFNDNNVTLNFENKQRAITPGQYAVLYKNKACIGGGKISKVIF